MKTPSKNKACRDRRDAMLSVLEDRLSAESALRFDAHLASCPNCAAEFASLKRTLTVLDESVGPPTPAEPMIDMRRRVRVALAEPESRRALPLRSAWGLAAALILIALFWWGGQRPNQEAEKMLARVEQAGRASLDEGLDSAPDLLEQVLREDFPVDDDLDLLIDELTSVELEALSRRLASLTVPGSERDPS